MTHPVRSERVTFLLDHSRQISPAAFSALISELHRLGCLDDAERVAILGATEQADG